MGRPESFRQYAAECVAQAESQQSTGDKTILLNMALAWVRLAEQTKSIGTAADDGEDAPRQDIVGPVRPIQ